MGTGLGLTIVRELAQAMRGTVHVDSTPGGGTVVVVALPLHELRIHAQPAQLRQRGIGNDVLRQCRDEGGRQPVVGQ